MTRTMKSIDGGARIVQKKCNGLLMSVGECSGKKRKALEEMPDSAIRGSLAA